MPTDSQVMTKNETFPLNHSLAGASYAIYLAIHTCICNEDRKNRKSVANRESKIHNREL